VTGQDSKEMSEHDYEPFGLESNPLYQETAGGFDPEDPKRFTGHERDYAPPGESPASTAYLDYMHARFYSSNVGRFLSVDPAVSSMRPQTPQSWNRFAYVINNPLRYIDPFGLDWFKLDGKWQYLKDIHEVEQYTYNKNGQVTGHSTIQGVKYGLVFSGTGLTQLRADGTMRTLPAASGKISGWGEVHPELQSSAKRGPIPEGLYTFNRSDIQDWYGPNGDAYMLATALGRGWRGGTHAWGTIRAPFTPAPGTNTYGRGGFFLHGGAVPGSAGCIDVCDRIVDVFSDIPRSVDTVPVDVDYGHPFSPP
jgi:RHS repeat-associated protein